MKSNIPYFIKKTNVTVSAISDATGLSRTTLTPLSKSEEIPSKTRIETLTRLADFFKVNVNDLFQTCKYSTQFIDDTRLIDGERVPPEKLSYLKKYRLKLPKVVKRYLGFLTLTISHNKKPLLVGYTSFLGSTRFEIFGESDFSLLFVVTDLTPLGQNRFRFEDYLNSNKSFTNSLNGHSLNDILREIVEYPVFQGVFKDAESQVVRNYTPKYSLLFSSTNNIYYSNFSNPLFPTFKINTNGKISHLIAEYYAKEIKTRSEQEIALDLIYPFEKRIDPNN